MRLENKVALITGAASGMGQAAAVEFAREGARVAMSDVNEEGLAETASLVRDVGGVCISITGNVADAGDVATMVGRTVDAFGALDILYSNAAIYLPNRGDAPVVDLDEEVWQRVIDVNLKGVYLCAKHAIPAMIRGGGGSIINASSLAEVVFTRGTTESIERDESLVRPRRVVVAQLCQVVLANIAVDAVHVGAAAGRTVVLL